MIIIYGMSGSGKDSILTKMQEKYKYKRIPSFVTRKKRARETHGVDGYFFTKEEVMQKINNGEVAQWVDQGGILYGTLKKDYHNADNKIAIMNPQALQEVRKNNDIEGIIGIYIERPEKNRVKALQRRNGYEERLELDNNIKAGRDLADYIIVNDGTIEEAADKIQDIVLKTNE